MVTLCSSRWSVVRGWRLVTLLTLFILPLLWSLGGREAGRLPRVQPQGVPPTHIEPAWAAGATSEGGFLAVGDLLEDPRTTRHPARPREAVPEEAATLRAHTIGGEELAHVIADSEAAQVRTGGGVDHPEARVVHPSSHQVARVKGDIMTARLKGAMAKGTMVKGTRVKGTRVKSDLAAARTDNNNSDFLSVMSYNSHFEPHLTRDLYLPGYRVENQQACGPERTAGALVAILVISAPEHAQQRAAIRATWGKADQRVVFSFIVGSTTGDLKEEVEAEARREGDLIISLVEDHYENLGLKTISALDWVVQLCSEVEYVLKVDDDMFVQVERLVELVEALVEEDKDQMLVLGNISRGWKPVRNPKSKYYITEAQYGAESYPDFATGPSYLVSRAAVGPMVEAALDQLYIHLEDVFLTGVVAEQLGVERRNNDQFKNNAVRVPARFMGCTLLHTITIHKVGVVRWLPLLVVLMSW